MRWMVLGAVLAGCGKEECPTVEAAYDAGCADGGEAAYAIGKSWAEECEPVTEAPVADPVEPLNCKEPTPDMEAEYARGWEECWVDQWFLGYEEEGTAGCGGQQ